MNETNTYDIYDAFEQQMPLSSNVMYEENGR